MCAKARFLVVLLALSLSVFARADFRTVGVYDVDDGPHHNQVDQSGVYDSHTGGAGPDNVVDLATFQELVERAFAADVGGVIDGEGPDDNLPSDDIIVAHFGINATKSVSFESTSGNLSHGSGGGSGNRLPLSGDHRFAKGSTNDFIFTIGAVDGGEPDEAITFFAGSLIERDNRETTPEVTATFSDGSTVTATADMVGDDDSPNDKDTFFGFMAPAGTSIVSVEFQLNEYVHLDEIGFITSSFVLHPERASSPRPSAGATDVPTTVVLSWTPGEGAVQHDVYLGMDYDAVNAAERSNPLDVLASQAQGASTFGPERPLELGRTYYWRVDEVQGATIYKGDVWEFTVEPVAYPLAGPRIAVAASSAMDPNTAGAENTVNESGLTEDDLHGVDLTTMWLSAPEGLESAWIEYSFDKVYALHELHVWNYNGEGLNTMYGLREATIEYSPDGVTWTALENVPEFAQAPGTADYAPDIVIDFNDVVARQVRITALSNWSPGGVFDQYGLSEVRFLYVPLRARALSPAPGSAGVDPNVVLSWRAGRQAATHEVYLGGDPNDLPLADVVTGAPYAAYDTTAQGLELGRTYYWQVNEVNELEAPDVWEGDVSEFSTRQFLVVDDFESYTNDAATFSRVFQTWIDGAGYTNPVEVPGNGTGSYMGHDPSLGDIMETGSVHGGAQSAPLYYGNAGQSVSEVDRTFDEPQDWTVMGIRELAVHYQGFPTALVQDPNGALRLSAGGDNMMSNDVTADGCRFVYKQLSGDGSIIARLESHPHIHNWGKAGVMIRESLDPGAKGVSLYATGTNGIRIGFRDLAFAGASHTGGSDPAMANQEEPVWLKLERSGNNISAFFTPDPATQDWIPAVGNPRVIPMGSNVLIGLALTSRYQTRPITAVFTDVSAEATGPWQVGDVGELVPANEPAQLYVAIEDASGKRAVVNHADGDDSVLNGQWTAWPVPLDGFAGVDLSQVKTLTLGVSSSQPGAMGLVLIDDIELWPQAGE